MLVTVVASELESVVEAVNDLASCLNVHELAVVLEEADHDLCENCDLDVLAQR